MVSVRKTMAVMALLLTVCLASSPPPASAAPVALTGRVLTGTKPLASYTVTVFATNGSSSPAVLTTTTTAGDGRFTANFEPPSRTGSVVYAIAHAPARPAVHLATVVGLLPLPSSIVINERTTAAAGYAMAQFMTADELAGPAPGLQNAAGMSRNLADPTTGELSAVLTSSPNGTDTSTLTTFNSVANIVAACVAADVGCVSLLDATTISGRPVPTNAFQAVGTMARDPWNKFAELYAVSLTGPVPYQPARTSPPDAWTIALRFVGDGHSMDGPGNMAVDTDGNVWVTNNYIFDADVLKPACGSDLLLKFTPTGQYATGTPIRGGGLNGAGFGIDIDIYGQVWVGNFGFAAPETLPDGKPGCPADKQPPHNSVSLFAADGTPLSPSTGFTQGISWPQGMTADAQGNVWTANCESNSVTVYRGGDPNQHTELTNLGLTKPFGAAHNQNGTVFVVGVTSDNVAVINPDGTTMPGSPVSGGGIKRPMGIATDRFGNAWVSNSGFVDVPCPLADQFDFTGGSVSVIGPDGKLVTPTPYTGGGMVLPWGIAIDGNDNAWVVNFASKRLSELCGMSVTNCRPGAVAGSPISPDVTGYSFDGLTRNTGVVVDPSGNVWIANNWKEVPIQSNPGGYEMVVYVGLAGPVHRAAPQPKPSTPTTPTSSTPAVVAVPRFTG